MTAEKMVPRKNKSFQKLYKTYSAIVRILGCFWRYKVNSWGLKSYIFNVEVYTKKPPNLWKLKPMYKPMFKQ